MNLDLSNMPAFDASSISIDPSAIDLSSMNLDFSGLDINLDGAQPTIKTDTLTQGVMAVVQGYPAWLTGQLPEHPEYADGSKRRHCRLPCRPHHASGYASRHCRFYRFQRHDRPD